MTFPAPESGRPTAPHAASSGPGPGRLADVVRTMGGERLLGRIDDPLNVHDLIRRGLPTAAVRHLIESFEVVPQPEVARAMGVSLRTVQRLMRKDSAERLNAGQSDHAWQLAEVVTRAEDVFGSREAAESWLSRPAIGLDQRRPIDLLGTSAGTSAVKTYLDRIDLGIYA